MSFLAFFPDWNSLESVRRAHSDLEGAALVFFALLVVFDVLAHMSDSKDREALFEKIALWFFGVAVLAEIAAFPYGQRNDDLSEQAMAALRRNAGEAKQSALDAADAASRANVEAGQAKASADGASTSAEDAVAELIELRRDTAARHLTETQKEELRKTLEEVPTPIAVGWSPIDSEAGDFAGDFIAALSSAKWRSQAMLWFPNGKYGVFLGFTDLPAKETLAFKSLVSAFKSIGVPLNLLQLPVGDKTIGGSGAESHVLYLLIGTHPPVHLTSHTPHTPQDNPPVKQ